MSTDDSRVLARAVHDLGAALWFGGAVMGVAGVNSIPNAQTPPELATWQRRQRASQYLVPLASGANIVLNAHLVQTCRPGATARGLVRTLLPG